MELSTQKKIIILERNSVHKDYLRSIVSQAGDLAFCFQQETTCLDNLFQLDPALIVMGLFPQDRSIRFMNALRAIDCDLPVIMISEDLAVRRYLAANRLGNILVVDSAWNGPALEASVQTVLSKHKKGNQRNRHPFIVGNNPDVVKMKTLLPELSRSTESILIQGEKGVGKELLARAIHIHSKNNGMFIKIDASALAIDNSSLQLIHNLKQILGQRKQKKAKTGQSKAGTLYVHEIGDMPSHLQAELLIIADKTGIPFESRELRRINAFRVIAGSSNDLEKEVTNQHFRKDLFYRLNTLQVAMPPLRCRKEDIPLLTDFFTYKFCKKFDKSYFELSAVIKDRFQNYRWPGNIHELEGAVRRAVMLNSEKEFLNGFLAGKLHGDFQNNHSWLEGVFSVDDIFDVTDCLEDVERKPLKDICWKFMARVEKNIINKALKHTNWNRKKAAFMLNISYKSLLNKIKQYKLV
jgi:DNA-binding NtrC family response regulator